MAQIQAINGIAPFVNKIRSDQLKFNKTAENIRNRERFIPNKLRAHMAAVKKKSQEGMPDIEAPRERVERQSLIPPIKTSGKEQSSEPSQENVRRKKRAQRLENSAIVMKKNSRKKKPDISPRVPRPSLEEHTKSKRTISKKAQQKLL